MKKKLMVSLLLAVSLILAACSQQGAVPETTDAKESPAVQEDLSPEANPVTGTDMPMETVKQEPALEESTTEEPILEEDAETLTVEAELTAEQKEFMEFYGLEQFPDNMTPEDYEEMRMLMYAFQEPEPPAGAINTAESEAYYEEPVELPTRSEEEALAIVTEIADNFKSGPYYPTLEGAALEYLDVNLDTLRNNPKSNSTLKTYIEYYENGSSSEERFRYSIESWIRIAGPYGSKNITVQ